MAAPGTIRGPVRAFGAGLAATALVATSTMTAAATPDATEPTPAPSISEQLAQLGDKAIADRWFVELDGTTPDQLVGNAKKQGVDVTVSKTFSRTWNGASVNVDDAKIGTVIPWDGTYQGNKGNDKTRRVSDGDYVLEIRILKAMGDPSNPDHWESWDSTPFTITYGEGSDGSAEVGPGANNRNPNKGPGNNKGKN